MRWLRVVTVICEPLAVYPRCARATGQRGQYWATRCEGSDWKHWLCRANRQNRGDWESGQPWTYWRYRFVGHLIFFPSMSRVRLMLMPVHGYCVLFLPTTILHCCLKCLSLVSPLSNQLPTRIKFLKLLDTS